MSKLLLFRLSMKLNNYSFAMLGKVNDNSILRMQLFLAEKNIEHLKNMSYIYLSKKRRI